MIGIEFTIGIAIGIVIGWFIVPHKKESESRFCIKGHPEKVYVVNKTVKEVWDDGDAVFEYSELVEKKNQV